MKQAVRRTLTAGLTMLVMSALNLASAAPERLSTSDIEFLNQAAQGGLAEVALGGIAVSRASDPRVRAFGERMVSDHGGANEKLMKLADSKDCPLPETLAPQHRQLQQRLQTLQAGEFDHAYVKATVEDHEKDVAEFERQAREAEDPDVRRFAEETLPTLQSHLDAIRDLAQRLK